MSQKDKRKNADKNDNFIHFQGVISQINESLFIYRKRERIDKCFYYNKIFFLLTMGYDQCVKH